ncbi:hypothetical protein AB0K43_09060 [Kitasatospora sp. NPDC049258]|uniref:hypothetical protein n=1 Tax=Kitasatospora sp. NPDC049258 TaxID=3155394 RepID=UPI0034371CFF
MRDVPISGVLGRLLWPGAHWHTKRTRRSFEAGRPVVFAGAVLGDRPYCAPWAGLLHARAGELRTCPDRAGAPAEPHPLPLERLELVLVRARLRSDPQAIAGHWRVAECRDGRARVLVAAAPGHLEIVLGLLRAQQ